MSNHGYIYNCEIAAEDVQRQIEWFNRDELNGLFELEYKNECWTLSYGEESISLWIGEYTKTTLDDNDEVVSESTEPAIEIRHGHHDDFMWWVDFKLANYLAWYHNGKQADDGAGEFEVPPQPPSDYLEYYDDWLEAKFNPCNKIIRTILTKMAKSTLKKEFRVFLKNG